MIFYIYMDLSGIYHLCLLNYIYSAYLLIDYHKQNIVSCDLKAPMQTNSGIDTNMMFNEMWLVSCLGVVAHLYMLVCYVRMDERWQLRKC